MPSRGGVCPGVRVIGRAVDYWNYFQYMDSVLSTPTSRQKEIYAVLLRVIREI
jgi:hypothetical protein